MIFTIEQNYLIFKITAEAVSVAGFLVGVFSVIAPAKSVQLYQWIMGRINWNVAPIDAALEVKNTRRLSVWLVLLSMILAAGVVAKFGL